MRNYKKGVKMTKLSYPKDGIYRYCKHHAESCANNLSRAIDCCNFDMPNNFEHKGYLNGLSEKLQSYNTRIKNINSKLEKSNSNIKILSSDLLSSVNKMVSVKIVERDRMIY